MNKNLNEVLNYMKQYVENIYEHDSEPMLTWKDLKLVLEEIERLNNIIKEAKEEIEYFELQAKHLDDNIYLDEKLTNKLLEILDKVGEEK